MYIKAISPMILNLETYAEQSRVRASLHDGCNAGVIEAIASFHRVNLDTASERHGSRIPINDLRPGDCK